MAHNRVAANLLMLFFLVGGGLSLLRVNREVFPEARLEMVTVTVPYPGATPVEVVEGVVLPVEEAIRGVDGIDELRSSAVEGSATITAEVAQGSDPNRVLNDVENAVNRITSFPQDAEEPVIARPSTQSQVLSLVIYGDLDRHRLDARAAQARADLLRDERVSRVSVTGIPAPEISIEVPQAQLRRLGLSLPEIGRRVAAATVESGVGRIESADGVVSLRVMERRETAEGFRDIALVSTPDGVRVRLGDVATVRETFRDDDRAAFFNGQPAVNLGIFRGADQDPQATAKAVRDYVERQAPTWGGAVQTAIWNDFSRIYADRIGLLVKNCAQGLVVVLLILGLFLRPRLAFWVTLGIPVSFLGVFVFLPMMGISINMISLFAFILVLGVVVDDAIVVGEAAYQQRRHIDDPLQAAVAGTREVNVAIVAAVMTNVLAFTPMLVIPGVTGEFFRVIPLCVIPILLISLIESLFVLPTHVGHARRGEPKQRWARRLLGWQQRFADRFEHFVDTRYRRALEAVLRGRFLTLVAAVALLIVSAAAFLTGHVRFIFFPDIEGETVQAQLEMVEGTDAETTRRAMDRLVESMETVLAENGGADGLSDGTLAMLGQQLGLQSDPTAPTRGTGAGHLATVITTLMPADQRELGAAELMEQWRERVGEIPGAERVSFSSSVGPATGADVAFELSHREEQALEQAAARLAERLRGVEEVVSVDSGYSRGSSELRLRVKPAATAMGLTAQELAAQVRAAFFGFEAVRRQRGDEELRVYVRLPREDREQVATVEDLLVFTPAGELPLDRAAALEWERSYTRIDRDNGRRVITVSADLAPDSGQANAVSAVVSKTFLPEIARDFPELSWEPAGEQQEQRESLSSLAGGFTLAFLAIYALLATVFRSYVQPLLVMLAVPFGLIGAVAGHVLLGYELSLISVLGLVALSGVVVNDSLVLLDTINRRRGEGLRLHEAVVEGSIRRFRPVLLTSLTTFGGLAPMIAETSLQARFLIPMAISLGFGVIFVTPITLVLVPALYRIVGDITAKWRERTSED